MGRNDSADLPTIPAGQRNDILASRGGALRRAGFSEHEILAALLQVNRDRCDPPLEDREVETIARSVSRYAPAGAPIVRPAFREIRIVNGRVAS